MIQNIQMSFRKLKQTSSVTYWTRLWCDPTIKKKMVCTNLSLMPLFLKWKFMKPCKPHFQAGLKNKKHTVPAHHTPCQRATWCPCSRTVSFLWKLVCVLQHIRSITHQMISTYDTHFPLYICTMSMFEVLWGRNMNKYLDKYKLWGLNQGSR